jgi:hypothetical protein
VCLLHSRAFLAPSEAHMVFLCFLHRLIRDCFNEAVLARKAIEETVAFACISVRSAHGGICYFLEPRSTMACDMVPIDDASRSHGDRNDHQNMLECASKQSEPIAGHQMASGQTGGQLTAI